MLSKSGTTGVETAARPCLATGIPTKKATIYRLDLTEKVKTYEIKNREGYIDVIKQCTRIT